MISSLLLIMISLQPPGITNLNTATVEELVFQGGLTEEKAQTLQDYIFETGGLEDVYEIMTIPGFTVGDLENLRNAFAVIPPEAGNIPASVHDIMEKLAAEDGPGDAAVDEWEDLLIRPMPVNNLTSWDLRQLDRVSLVDAVAVERRLRTIGPVSSVTSLKNTDHLTYYGYRNLRDFVSTRELDLSSSSLFGNYRIIFEGGPGRGSDESGIYYRLSDLDSALHDFETGGRDYSGSPVDSASLYQQLEREYDELSEAENTNGWTHRVRIGLGDRLRGGVRFSRNRWSTAGYSLLGDLDMGTFDEIFDVGKACISLLNIGPVHQVILGSYRLSLGQGLMVDNTDEWRHRTLTRNWGLHNDLTSTRQFCFTGAATELYYQPLLLYAFYSSNYKDALKNQDGSPNALILSATRTTTTANTVQETAFGGYAFFDLGDILPIGTAIGLGGLNLSWSESFNPDRDNIDIPNDSYTWNCPEYETLPEGDGLNVMALAAQTVVGPFSIEGEIAHQDNEALAGLITTRWQNNFFYLQAAFRHYDLDYTNPYNRGFAEQTRFDDTVFEKPYYLNDPLASELENWPVPKPEEGIYLESRFQISRNIVIPRIYLDIWRSLPYDLDNYRFQGEVEYRPVFPLRFRLKYKLQEKQKKHDVVPTTSRTQEFTLRSFGLPVGHDYFDLRLRYGFVELTPNPRYGDDRLLSGGYLSAKWEHQFTDDFSILGGSTLWTTNGMSQWEFEDTGIDFLDGRGTKFYITFKNTLSDNLQMRFRILRKDTFFPHNGLYRPDPDDQYYYEGDPDSQVISFGDHIVDYCLRCQLDFRW